MRCRVRRFSQARLDGQPQHTRRHSRQHWGSVYTASSVFSTWRSPARPGLVRVGSGQDAAGRGGQHPGLRSPADLDRDDNEERAVEAITGFFSLPELEMP